MEINQIIIGRIIIIFLELFVRVINSLIKMNFRVILILSSKRIRANSRVSIHIVIAILTLVFMMINSLMLPPLLRKMIPLEPQLLRVCYAKIRNVRMYNFMFPEIVPTKSKIFK